MTSHAMRLAFSQPARLSSATFGGVAARSETREPTVAVPTNSERDPGHEDNFDVHLQRLPRDGSPLLPPVGGGPEKQRFCSTTRTAGPRHANIQPALAALGWDPPLSGDAKRRAKGHH